MSAQQQLKDLGTILIVNKKVKPKPSEVYNTYWRFAFERQNIFFNRFRRQLPPWTKDHILTANKFTNVYRSTDRVSQFLIKNVIYNGSQNYEDLFLRIILFKTFNRISTWERLENEFGVICSKEFAFKKYNRVLTKLLENNIRIYSPAYIMTSGRTSFGYEKKHQNHLKLIELMIRKGVPLQLKECKSMEEVYSLLLGYPTIGSFLAYQYATDINYSTITNFDEMDFVKAGPGAQDGVKKCFKDFNDYSFEDIIRLMAERQDEEFTRLGLNFQSLWGRKLQLIDCQNIFCEVDKYARVAHPKISGYSDRTRIKQKFKVEEKPDIEFFFPPKWGINKLIN